jgi:hypothetical protein
MSKGKTGLSARKEAAILALLQHRIDEAARIVDVSSRTLYRWSKEPEFAAAFREAQQTFFSNSLARLVQMSPAATSALGKILVDQSAPAGSRVRAADCVLKAAARGIEMSDLQARITVLEKFINTSKTDIGRVLINEIFPSPQSD